MLQQYLFIIVICLSALSARAADGHNRLREVVGEAVNGLKPSLLISHYDGNWFYEIDYYSQTNVSDNDWLRITNRCGAKLELWLNNGQKLEMKDKSALAAMGLPGQTSVSNIWSGVEHFSRNRLWLRFPLDQKSRSTVGESAASTTYSLKAAFGISFTNDVVLHLTPLLYRVDSNLQAGHLVEFPAICLRLLENGDVQKE